MQRRRARGGGGGQAKSPSSAVFASSVSTVNQRPEKRAIALESCVLLRDFHILCHHVRGKDIEGREIVKIRNIIIQISFELQLYKVGGRGANKSHIVEYKMMPLKDLRFEISDYNNQWLLLAKALRVTSAYK